MPRGSGSRRSKRRRRVLGLRTGAHRATPHVGGNTTEIAAHQGAIAIDQIRKLLAGERPDYILNPEALDVFTWSAPRPEPNEKTREALSKNKRPSVTS